MKNAILLYGRFSEKIDSVPIEEIPECNPNNEKKWMGWTKKQLEARGYHVTCPTIPRVWEAPYGAWEHAIDEAGVNEETVLVGLSAGATACVKFLTEQSVAINKLILVAPARFPSADSPDPTLYEFTTDDTTRQKIKNGTTIFVSDDDWAGIQEAVRVYEKELHATVIRFKDRGHFSFLIPTFPELLEEIINS